MRVKRSLFRASAASIALTLSLAALSIAQSPHSDKLSNIRIDNFGCINENYYRGAQPEKDDYAGLAALGVKTIIDLQQKGEADEQATVESLGMKFYRIGMTTRSGPDSGQVEQFLTIVNDPANQPVYVHCRGGRHRTGMMTALYRMARDSWSADRAYAEMKRYEFEKGFGHGSLKKYVYSYYGELSGQNATGASQKAVASSH
jgi:protein tyrosine/serine phosphatase